MSLISVAREDFSPGVPLPWVVYDQDGSLLLDKGAVLDTEEQIDKLLASNPLRELTWNSALSGDSGEDSGAPQGEMEATPFPEGAEGGFSFDDMRLRVGDRIQLQPPATVTTDRFIVRLIGYLENNTLLVTAPMDNGLRVPLRENDKIIARVFSSQKAFGFTSYVERVCKIPYDYIHLSFPKEIQGSVIRKSPRVRTKIIASIAGADATDSDRKSGLIVNLSADGALVRVKQQLCEKGATIQLSFRVNLHNIDAYLSVGAIVRSIATEEAGGGMFDHGIQFQNLLPNDSVILQSMIYQQMIEQPHSLT